MTDLGERTLAGWTRLPDGSMRRSGGTCQGGRLCMAVGESVAHSHYAWAQSEYWAVYGDLMGGK